eukprot:1712121-Amphidinium_carterae.1
MGARKVAETIIWLRSSPYCSSIEDGRCIKRFMSDKGGEFESDVFAKMLREQGVMQTNSPSYQPQSNGLAERMLAWPIASGPMLFNSQHNNSKLRCWDMNGIYLFSVNSWQFGKCDPKIITVWITEEH